MIQLHIFVLFIPSIVSVIISNICLPSEVYKPHIESCGITCDTGESILDQTCVEHCPIATDEINNGIASFCVIENDFKCDAACEDDFPFCYRMNCLAQCPEFTFEYRGECLRRCPDQAKYLTAVSCSGVCTNGRKSCSEKCPDTHPFTIKTKQFIQCLKSCPSFTEQDTSNSSCNLRCLDEKPFLYNNACYDKCPTFAPYKFVKHSHLSEIIDCVDLCPPNTVLDEDRCVVSCPKGKFLFNNTCVHNCPESFHYHYPRRFRKRYDIINFGRAEAMCVSNCSTTETLRYNGDLSYVAYHNICVERCPEESKYEYEGLCRVNCPSDHRFMKRKYNRIHCAKSCHEVVANDTCVSVCPNNLPFLYNKTCTESCPEGFHFSQVSRIGKECLKSCPKLYFGEYCLSSCPSNAKYQHNSTCLKDCSEADYPLKYSRQIRISWRYKNEYFCVDTCPGDKKYIYNDTCVTYCPSDKRLRYKNTCVSRCDYEDLPYEMYNECVNTCPDNRVLVNNLTCEWDCPYSANYIFNRNCLKKCPPERPFGLQSSKYFNYHKPLYYYITSALVCVDRCPEKMLQFKSSCVDVCPESTVKFNHECLSSCPISSPKNYTRNSKGFGIYECVENCPENTF